MSCNSTPHPTPHLVRCDFDITDLREPYLTNSRQDFGCLRDFDSDFSVFEAKHAPVLELQKPHARRRKKPRARRWLRDDGSLLPPAPQTLR